MEFSEYWYNEENFYVHQILGDEYKRVKRCESAKLIFQRKILKLVAT